jgi:phage terminase large subunit-like protein
VRFLTQTVSPDGPVLYLPTLREDQYRIAMHKAKVKVLAMGRRWGKTLMAGTIMIAAAVNGAQCAWCAPNYKNTNSMWDFLFKMLGHLIKDKWVVINKADRSILFPLTGGRIQIYTMDNADAMRGSAFHLVVVDEAARCPEEAWTDVIQPTLADYDGECFLISTPLGRNWFWTEFNNGLRDGEYTKAWNAPTSANPSPSIRRAAERARLITPEKTYQQEWLAEFIDDALVLFKAEWFSNRYDPSHFRHAHTSIARYISWDTGYKDKDDSAYSACVVADLMPDYRLQIREVYRERLSFPGLIESMVNIADKYRRDGKLRNVIIEDKASGTSAYQTIRASSEYWLANRLYAFMPTVSKTQRAAQAGVWAKHRLVILPRPGEDVPWLFPFEDEIYHAPKTQYMDQTDAFAQLLLFLQPVLRRGLYAHRVARDEYGAAPETVFAH